jgi:hypothetical protein
LDARWRGLILRSQLPPIAIAKFRVIAFAFGFIVAFGALKS